MEHSVAMKNPLSIERGLLVDRVKAAETRTAHALAPTHGIWDGE